MKFELVESRRLTGPNLWMNSSGAIIEVNIFDFAIEDFVTIWSKYTRELLNKLSWNEENIFYKVFENGVNIAFSAPIDALYAATEINEYAYDLTLKKIKNIDSKIDPVKLNTLKETIASESNPQLIKMKKAAVKHHVSLLSDDEVVSVGLGKGSVSWTVDNIPNPKDVDWKKVFDIPVALVTGTNGKSTTVRLLSEILQAEDYQAGITSTDFIKVGDKIIDRGDYSGPGGARKILRHKEVDIAVLEVARGGILRRGLPIEKAKTACVTNVAADHLGQYGVNMVEELAEVKFVVTKVVNDADYIVLNADDELSVRIAARNSKNIFWTSLKSDNALSQQTGCRLIDNKLEYHFKNTSKTLININDITFTFNGAAKHNIYNVMNTIGLAKSLGISDGAIVKGLRAFKSDSIDNPGRVNSFEINGAKILVDFAHNEHGMKSIIEMAKTIKAKRKLIMLGHAGDRSDQDIKALCKAAYAINPDCVIIAEIVDYLRGRKLGEIPHIFQNEFLKLGMGRKNILKGKNSIDAVEKALDWMQQGDFLLLMVLDNKEKILTKLNNLQNNKKS